jgi:ketosteroid isomerase-like protein
MTTEASGAVHTVHAYNEAWNRHDVDAMMRLSTQDTVFESTWPAPDGQRFEGAEQVLALWTKFFSQDSPQAHIDIEELFDCGERVVMRWRYEWVGRDGRPGHVRGVDVFHVRDGKVAEKLSYVKR